jgi:phage gp16-like protein
MLPKRKRKVERIDRQKIAVIHVAKTQLGLTDDEYRDALGSVGAASAKDLFLSQFNTLMRHFERMGFKSKNKKQYVKKSRTLMREKIIALMLALDVTDSYVDAIARHMGLNVDRWQWAEAAGLGKLIAALTYHKKRRK